MKVILTCGHPHSGYRMAHDILAATGLAQANPSRREGMSAQAWHENVFNAYELDPSGCRFDAQINPGKLWQELAVDLFLGNLDQKDWGWADARILPLLAFWKDFDPQIRFLLVYGTPEAAVGQMLKGRAVTPEDIDQAIASWTAYNTELLRFYNRNQDRCLLVNAAAVAHTPAALIEKASGAFGLKLGAPDGQERSEHAQACAVASSLAKALIADSAEAHALYRELESTADANAESADATQADKRQAWQEYVELLARMSETVEQAQAQGERATRLEHDVEAAARAHAEAQEQLTARQARETELQSLLEAKEAEARQLKESGHALARLKQELDAQIALLKESQSAARQRREAELNQLQGKNAELVKENELLMLQLHQVQEELEQHFIRSQALEKEKKKEKEEADKAIAQVRKQLQEQDAKFKEVQAAATTANQGFAQAKKQLQEQETKLKATQADTVAARQIQAQAEKQLAGLQEKHKTLQSALDATKAEAARVKAAEQALAQARKQLQEQEARLKKAETETTASSNAQAEIASLQAKAGELTQENELLLLQLHQVQEELENYFLKYQELARGNQAGIAQNRFLPLGWSGGQPAEVAYDLRREIDGDNWYYAEDGGRWAGPGKISTITVPALSGKEFEVELDVADAMAEDIVRGMEMSVNGALLHLNQDWDTYPARVQASVPTEAVTGQKEWEFRFTFPRLLSPAQAHGSDDERMLAIRIRRMVLRAVA